MRLKNSALALYVGIGALLTTSCNVTNQVSRVPDPEAKHHNDMGPNFVRQIDKADKQDIETAMEIVGPESWGFHRNPTNPNDKGLYSRSVPLDKKHALTIRINPDGSLSALTYDHKALQEAQATPIEAVAIHPADFKKGNIEHLQSQAAEALKKHQSTVVLTGMAPLRRN